MDSRFDCTLDSIGFLLADKGIAESGQQANPYAGKVMMGEVTHQDMDIWAVWQQNDWVRGFGEERWEDGARFSQSVHVDTRVRSQFILGPRKHRSNSGTGVLYAPAPPTEATDDDNPKGTHFFGLGRQRENDKEITKIAQQFKANRDIAGTTGTLSTRDSSTAGTITARRKVFANLSDGSSTIRFRVATTWYAGVANETIGGTAQATLDIDGVSPNLPVVDSVINAMQVAVAVTESGSVYTLTDLAARFEDSEIQANDRIVCTISSARNWRVSSITSQTQLVVKKGSGDSDLATGAVTAYVFGIHISSISFQAYKKKNPHSNMKVMLYSDSGSDAPNALLQGDSSKDMSVTLASSNFAKELGWVTVSFPDEYPAIYGTLYWIVWEMQNTEVGTSTGTTTLSNSDKTVTTAGTWDLSRARTWQWVKDDTSGAYGKIDSIDVSAKSVTVESWTGTPAGSHNYTVYWKCDARGWYKIAYNRHWNDSDYSPYSNGKASRSVAHDGTLLSASNKWDFYFRVNEGGALKGDVMWIKYFKPDLDVAGRLCCGTYDSSASKSYMYFYDTSVGLWVADGAWSGRVQDATTFDTDLWVAQGATYTAKYLDSNYAWQTAPEHDWTGNDVVDTTATRRLASHGGYLYCTYQANKVAYTPTPTDATPAWSSQITVGHANSRVVNMQSWGERLAIGKANGLYVIKGAPGDSDTAELVLPLDALWDNENFQAMAVWNGDLYFNVKHAIYRMSPMGDWTNIGPTQDRGLAQNERGYPRSFVVTPGYLYVAIDAGADRRSTWMCYNGMGWHPLQEAHKDGDRIRELCYDFQANPDRLWWNEGGDMCYAYVPEQTDNPYHHTSYEYAPQGHLLSSWFDANLPDIDKEFYTVRVESDNIKVDPGGVLHTGFTTHEAPALTATRDKDEDDATIDFTAFVTEADFVKGNDGTLYAITSVVSATALTVESGIGDGEYYEIISGSDAAELGDSDARWVEVEYRVDTLSNSYWTYLGAITRSPIQELSFPKDTITDITLASVLAYGKAHTKGHIWLTDASELDELSWVYVDDASGTGDYAQIATLKTIRGSDASATKLTKVTFVMDLDFKPAAGDIIKSGIPWGKAIQLRFNPKTNAKNQTPKVRATALKYLNIINDKAIFNLTIEATEGGELHGGAFETRTLQEVYDELEEIAEKGRITLELRSGTFTVETVNWSWRTVKLEKRGEAWLGSQRHYLTLIEV